jgi:SOS response regulatory protein OraA/RecX
MLITNIKAGASLGTYLLECNDASPLEINSAYLDKSLDFLAPGALFREEIEIDDEDAAALQDAAAATACEKAALALVTRAEQCRAGLERKLKLKKHSAEAVAAVLARLCSQRLVDDRRYAELWLKGAVARGTKGPRALSAALRAKGLDKADVSAALDAALSACTRGAGEDATAEDGLLRRCAQKAGKKKNGPEGREQVRWFLKNEGFSAEAIGRYLADC